MNEILDIDKLKMRKRLAINGIIMVVNTAGKSNILEKENIIIKTTGFILQDEYKETLIEQIIMIFQNKKILKPMQK